jgi:hypothetical protein
MHQTNFYLYKFYCRFHLNHYDQNIKKKKKKKKEGKVALKAIVKNYEN